MTWVRYANKLEEENTKLKGLLEEALGCIDQYDYEEAFDMVQRIKTALGLKPIKAIQWGDNTVTEAEELLQKVQQLKTDNAALREQLRAVRQSVYRAKEIEIPSLLRENAALRSIATAMADEMEQHGGDQAFDSLARYRAARAKEDKP